MPLLENLESVKVSYFDRIESDVGFCDKIVVSSKSESNDTCLRKLKSINSVVVSKLPSKQ